MVSLSLPDGRYMYVESTAECLTLTPEFGGAQVAVRLQVWTQNTPQVQEQIAAQMTATLLVGRTSNPSEMQALAALGSESLVYTHTTPGTVTVLGHVSTQALREVEEARSGGDLWLVLAGLKLVTITGTSPVKLAESVAGPNVAVRVRAGQWAEEFEKVTDSSYVELLVPVTGDPELAIAAGRLSTARALIRRGDLDTVAAPLRQVLDSVRAFYKTLEVYRVAEPKKPKERDLNERFAMYVQNLFSWLSSFEHDDEDAIKGLVMDPAEANMALAAVAGLLHRLARDRAAVNL